MLKSNGLRHSKNPPVRFSFSPKTVPVNIAKKLPPQRCSKPIFIALFNFSHKWTTFAFTSESGYTLAFVNRIAHKGLHGETQTFQMGRYHYPRRVPHVHEHPRAGCQNGVLCRFWVLAVGTPEERRKPAGQRCAHARRCPAGVAAPLGCVIFFYFCQNCDFYALRTQGLSACARRGWYHYPRRALRVAETLDGRLPKRLVCRFLRSMGIAPCATPIFLRIYRYPCR